MPSFSPPFNQASATRGDVADASTGRLVASASTPLAGYDSAIAAVGQSFQVPAGATSVRGSAVLDPLYWYCSAGVFLGYFSSSVEVSILLFRGSSPFPVARSRTHLYQAIAPAFWFHSRSGWVPPLVLSVSTPRSPASAAETWTVGVALHAYAGGFGGGSAFAHTFTRVRTLNCF